MVIKRRIQRRAQMLWAPRRNAAASAPSFSPTDIAGLVFRVKASTGVFTDAAKTTPAVNDDDLIGAWADSSASAKDVTQATTGLKPKLKLNILNGKPVIRWDGSDDRLINATFALNQPSTMFIVGKGAASDTTGNTFIDSYANVQSQFYNGGPGGGAAVGKFTPNAGTLVDSTIKKNIGFNPHCINFNGAATKYYLGAKYVTTINCGANAFSGLSVGNIRGNPNPLSASYTLTGDEAEILIYNSTLSDADRNNVFSYLVSEYNLRQIIFDGNSLTLGTGAVVYSTDYPSQVCTALGVNYAAVNFGVASQTTPMMTADAATQIDPLYSTPFSKIICVWEGTNDMVLNATNATDTYNNLVTYCQARRAAGYKVVILTIIKRGTFTGGQETIRQTVNANIVANFATWADVVADVGAAAELQNTADTTYYNADTIHLTATGYGIVAAIVKTAIQSIGG